MYDASTAAPHITDLTSGAGIYLRLVEGCNQGASVEIPSGVATIVSEAKATDGHLVAVGIHPVRQHFTITVTHPDGSRITVAVDLS